MKRSPTKSRYRNTGPPPEVVDACLDRALYSCEVNGCNLDGTRGHGWSLQHRMPRGRGGTRDPRINLPSNLLVVCGSGSTGCHGLIENELRGVAYQVNWLLRRCTCFSADCVHAPRHQQVWLLRERWVYLTDAGTYEPANPPEGVAWCDRCTCDLDLCTSNGDHCIAINCLACLYGCPDDLHKAVG